MKKFFFFSILFTSVILPQESRQSVLSLKSQLQFSNSQIIVLNNGLSMLDPDLPSRKNPGLAILYSLLLPGMGELYAGGYDTGVYFTVADGLLWGTLAGFSIYGNWQEKNYKSFAETNAGVILSGKESEFFANIGSYLSVEDYNKVQELNREFGKVYDTQKFYWKWENNDKRREYREMWSSSESAFNNLRFAAGALILNRLISAINAVRLVSAYNKNLQQELSWNVYFSLMNNPDLPQSFQINFIKSM